MIRHAVILVMFILLASCGGQVKDSPAPRDMDYSNIPDAVPKYEPITRAGNKSPYRVLGKTYHVLPTFKNYRERGKASWYGPRFHGNPTSNGEPYDMYGMTAAHKTLPIPCYVQVTNLQNGRTAIVRVNDRGPFYQDRVIDLSFAAAKKLGVYDHGTAEVEVVAIDPAAYERGYRYDSFAARQTAPAPKSNYVSRPAEPVAPQRSHASSAAPQVAANSNREAFLQVGAFSSQQAADHYRRQSLNDIQYPSEVRQVSADGKSLYKVLVGPFQEQSLLLSARDILKQQVNLSSFVIYD